MRATLVVALFVVGCTGTQGPKGDTGPAGAAGARGEPGVKGDTGERGEQGPAGPQGVPGPVSGNGRVVVWVDATGAVIGPEPVFIDDAGVRWPLDVETGAPSLTTTSPSAIHRGFISDNCTGTEYVSALAAPREAFVMRSFGAPDVFVARSDAEPAVPVTTGSLFDVDGGCRALPSGGLARGVPISSLRAAGQPPPPATGPLHREWR